MEIEEDILEGAIGGSAENETPPPNDELMASKSEEINLGAEPKGNEISGSIDDSAINFQSTDIRKKKKRNRNKKRNKKPCGIEPVEESPISDLILECNNNTIMERTENEPKISEEEPVKSPETVEKIPEIPNVELAPEGSELIESEISYTSEESFQAVTPNEETIPKVDSLDAFFNEIEEAVSNIPSYEIFELRKDSEDKMEESGEICDVAYASEEISEGLLEAKVQKSHVFDLETVKKTLEKVQSELKTSDRLINNESFEPSLSPSAENLTKCQLEYETTDLEESSGLMVSSSNELVSENLVSEDPEDGEAIEFKTQVSSSALLLSPIEEALAHARDEEASNLSCNEQVFPSWATTEDISNGNYLLDEEEIPQNEDFLNFGDTHLEVVPKNKKSKIAEVSKKENDAEFEIRANFKSISDNSLISKEVDEFLEESSPVEGDVKIIEEAFESAFEHQSSDAIISEDEECLLKALRQADDLIPQTPNVSDSESQLPAAPNPSLEQCQNGNSKNFNATLVQLDTLREKLEAWKSKNFREAHEVATVLEGILIKADEKTEGEVKMTESEVFKLDELEQAALKVDNEVIFLEEKENFDKKIEDEDESNLMKKAEFKMTESEVFKLDELEQAALKVHNEVLFLKEKENFDKRIEDGDENDMNEGEIKMKESEDFKLDELEQAALKIDNEVLFLEEKENFDEKSNEDADESDSMNNLLLSGSNESSIGTPKSISAQNVQEATQSYSRQKLDDEAEVNISNEEVSSSTDDDMKSVLSDTVPYSNYENYEHFVKEINQDLSSLEEQLISLEKRTIDEQKHLYTSEQLVAPETEDENGEAGEDYVYQGELWPKACPSCGTRATPSIHFDKSNVAAESIRHQIIANTRPSAYKWPDFDPSMLQRDSVTSQGTTASTHERRKSLGRRITSGFRNVFPCLPKREIDGGVSESDLDLSQKANYNKMASLPRNIKF